LPRRSCAKAGQAADRSASAAADALQKRLTIGASLELGFGIWNLPAPAFAECSQQRRSRQRQSAKQISQSHRRVHFEAAAMHARYAGELSLEMACCARIRIMSIEIRKGSLQQ